MHSNNSGSLRVMSASDVNLIAPKRKSTVASQTENCSKLCNLREMSVQEIKDQYDKTLSFLNDCHEYMNEIFTSKFNSNKVDFRVPAVPNYFSLLEMFLERNKVQEIRTKRDLLKDQKWFVDLRIAQHGNGKTNKQEQFPINLKSLSTAFEEIYKTCNNFESKSEILNTKHKPPIKFRYKEPSQEKPKFNPEQGDQALQRKSTIEIELDESFIESHLSFTESMENFIESDQSLSEFINSETLSNSEPHTSSLSENLNVQQLDEENGNNNPNSYCEDVQEKSITSKNDCVTFEAGSSKSSTVTEINQRKSYPFTLSNRDKCRDDIKEIITAMGLYTENGDIRPNIIQLLDKEWSTNSLKKSVKFPTKRQMEIQVHYNNQNMRVASEEELVLPSEGNLNNLSVLTGSSSTIVSESEVINIENHNKQKRIN